MATALDVEFARRYYAWFWDGRVPNTLPPHWVRQQSKRRGAKARQQYREIMRTLYSTTSLATAEWDTDAQATPCEVCLRMKVPTLLVKVDGAGLISGDTSGDLVCAKCHPEAETRIHMVCLGDMVGA